MSILLSIIVSRFLLSIWWFCYKANGFFMLFGDSCSRTHAGICLARHGLIEGFPHGHTWLPLHFYILAFIFKIIPDTISVPPILSSVFFVGSIFWVYRIARCLFDTEDSKPVALFACSIIAFYSWFFNQIQTNYFFGLSLSGMSDPIFHFFILGGISLFLDFVHDERKKCLFLSAFMFLLSTALRYEGWGFVAIISIFLLIRFVRSLRENRPDWFILISILVMYLFIPFWLYDQYSFRGNPLYFAKWTFEFSQTGLNLFQRVFFYPALLVKIDVLITVLAIFGILCAVINRYTRKVASIFVMIIVMYILSLMCMSSFFGPVGFISRPVAIVFFMLIPFCSYAVFIVFKKLFGRKFAIALLIVIVSFMVFKTITEVSALGRFGFACDETVEIGRKAKEFYDKGVLLPQDKILLEMMTEKDVIHDFWAIRLFLPFNVLLDRNDEVTISCELMTEGNPSIFDAEISELEKYLEEEKIKSIILTSEKYSSKIKILAKQEYKNKKYKLFLTNR